MILPLSLLCLLSGAPVVNEVAAPLPIDDVEVFSDRARIARRATLALPKGKRVIVLPDLPGALYLNSLRFDAGPKIDVLRLESSPIERERLGIEEVDAFLKKLQDIDDNLAQKQSEIRRVNTQLGALANLRAKPPMAEKDRPNKSMVIQPNAWSGFLSGLAQRRVRLRGEQSALLKEQSTLLAERQRLAREISALNQGGFSQKRIQVRAIVNVKSGGKHNFELRYNVPGALWRPAYDLDFNPAQKTVDLKASALVTQATGEAWDKSKLAFSTSIPSQNIELPKLLTWTLGDDREFVPKARAKNRPRVAPRYQSARAKPTAEEVEAQANAQILKRRTQTLFALAAQNPNHNKLMQPPPPPRPRMDPVVASREQYAEEMSEKVAAEMAAAPMVERARRKKRATRARSRSRSSADYDSMDEEDESSIFGDAVEVAGALLGGGSAPRQRSLALELSSPGLPPPTIRDPTLPAALAGGLDILYRAPGRTSVPGKAQRFRVPFAERTFKVKTFYEATPALSKNAYLKARVQNDAGVPILAGPASLFVKGTFSGDAQLRTTEKGGYLEMPLGADEDIRLTHTVIPKTVKSGVIFGKKEVTSYEVIIDVANYKKERSIIYVYDVLPKTNNEDMSVKLNLVSPAPKGKVDVEGLMTWRLVLEGGKTQQIKYTYSVTRPAGWRIHQ